MVPQPQPTDRPVLELSARRPRRQVSLWVVILAVLAASSVVPIGVFLTGDYIVAHTTVTINLVSWSVPIQGHREYDVSCQSFDGVGDCPYHVKPGSIYTTSVLIPSMFSGMNVSLYAPSPFSIASTDPSLPALVPSSGLPITVHLTLPGSPGPYSFTGSVTFS